MGRLSKALTKHSTVLGLPIGKRRTDWAKLGRASMVGLSAISEVADLADGLRSARDDREADSASADGAESPDRNGRARKTAASRS